MAPLERALDRLTDALVIAGIVVMILMAVHVVLDVLSKFFFNFPLAGTLEIVAHYYMVGLIFAPLAHVQRKNGHIAAELLVRFLPERARHWLDTVIFLAMAGFAALLVWRAGVEALRSFANLEHVQTSGYFVYIFPARWFVPVGLGVMASFALAQAARTLLAAAARR